MNTMTYNQAMEYIDQEKCASYVLKSQPGKTSFTRNCLGCAKYRLKIFD